ncbi:unnamed protein product [Lampetra fluviatilis]
MAGALPCADPSLLCEQLLPSLGSSPDGSPPWSVPPRARVRGTRGWLRCLVVARSGMGRLLNGFVVAASHNYKKRLTSVIANKGFVPKY